MSVKFLVDDIALKAPGWSRARILRKLNDGQNWLFSKPCRQTIYLDPTTGFPPYLTTVAGTFKYEIPDVTMTVGGVSRSLRIWRVNQVFVDSSNITDYNYLGYGYLGEPFGFCGVNPYTNNTGKIEFKQVYVESYEARENDKAYILFKSDPGDTTNVYYVEGVIEPLQLTTESLPLTLPKRWEDALFDYVVGKIQDQGYGKDSLTQRFHEFWAEKLWYEQSQGTQGDSPFTNLFT